MPDFPLWGRALQQADQRLPCLILDRDRYISNLKLAQERLQPGVAVRVVAKSLACLPMLDLALDHLQAVGLMTFSAGMLKELLQLRPEVEHLLGKPLPVSVAADLLDQQGNARDRVIWLIDTENRALQYAQIAQSRGISLRIALELDVGLHRGGLSTQELEALVVRLQQEPGLRLEGIMGYEPHLAKLPGLLRKRSEARVKSALKAASDLLRSHGHPAPLINTGGSLTFANYSANHGVSEVSLGSVLVKPADFEMDATQGFQSALFIATPILKYRANNPIPGLEFLAPLTSWRRRAALAIYGGYWKGQPVYPAGFGYSDLFGRSSNQEVWVGPALEQSPVDNFAFLHPDQSEAIIPEFGQVMVLSKGQVTESWHSLSMAP